jgi:DNA-binding transcriptional LysR family regulator
LRLSAQMVGKHVMALEDRLGARLLNRTTRRQSLTEFGRLYYERCKLVMAEVEAADAVARDLHRAPRGRLRINAPVTFGTYGLVPLVARYLRTYPDVDVDLVLSDRMVDPVEESFEAVIRLGPLADSTLVARPLAPYRLIACASPAYLREHGAPAVPADLANHQCLGFAYWSPAPAGAWQFSRDGRTEAVKVRSRLRINDSKALVAAALEGLGIVLGHDALLKNDLAAGRLVRILPDYEAPSRPMHILFAAERRPTPKLRRFIEMVEAEFGPKG